MRFSALGIVAASGLALGTAGVSGIRLGSAGVLFAGIFLGQLGLGMDPIYLSLYGIFVSFSSSTPSGFRWRLNRELI